MHVHALRRLFILIACLLGFGFVGTAHAQVFRAYLAFAGNDANACTLAQPCRTLTRGVQAVTAGGEIWMLDSANYNAVSPVSITKSVTILAVPGVLGSVSGIGGDAILVGTAGVKVTLRNVNIQWSSGAGNGVNVTGNAAQVTLDKCEIIGFSGGAGVRLANVATVAVVDSTIRNNANGIIVSSGGAATVSRSALVNNTSAGLNALSAVAGTEAFVSDTVSSGNGIGFLASGQGRIFATRSIAVANVTAGFRADAPGVVTVAESMASGSTNGFAGSISTTGTSMVVGNTSDVGGATLTPVQPR